MNKQKKIEKINKEITQLEHELENSYRSGLRYNSTQKEKINKEKDYKKWLRYQNKIQFYKELVDKTEVKIKRLKLEQDNLKLDIVEEEYRKKLQNFDKQMKLHLGDLVENLNNILNSQAFDPEAATRAYDYYAEANRGLKKDDLWVFLNMGISTIKDRYNYIMEWLVEANRKDEKIKSALKASKVDTFANLMKRLTLSCIAEIEKRNSKTIDQKIKGIFSK